MTVRLLLLEDEDLVRSGLRMILDADPGIEVAAEAADGSEVVALVTDHRPDVVLTDIQMPRVDGLAVVERVRALPDAPPVVVLTTFDLDSYVHTALRHGAAGFLLKDIAPRDLVTAVQVVAGGEAMISPRITKRLLTRFTRESGREDALARLDALTAREREVALTLGRGLSNTEIARELGISESTVKVHAGHVMTKLGAANRTQVAIVVHDAGLS
ncbi:response regulator transcription factor [Amycolatopsis acidicola]|uniref:Response regulator transcription factor n=1 Tax=Amycolatopsis acidicola TaxID=2596893 RepID=A0A5N0V169_9PSEU|nr:response regulator transcription factor [Amycolatopsis acidicola]KAA9158110.1 response regulator transcription factor [Amycolatopsis acidicola]